jgi:hypothetical protein
MARSTLRAAGLFRLVQGADMASTHSGGTNERDHEPGERPPGTPPQGPAPEEAVPDDPASGYEPAPEVPGGPQPDVPAGPGHEPPPQR